MPEQMEGTRADGDDHNSGDDKNDITFKREHKSPLFRCLTIWSVTVITGLPKFRAVAEPRNSDISAKSREIDKNT